MFKIKFRKNNTKRVPPCPSGVYWQVDSGDTLYLISKKLNVSVEELIAANPHINPKNLKIGSYICIPLSNNQQPAPTD